MTVNLYELIRALRAEKQRLDRAIAALAGLEADDEARSCRSGLHRRGRKWMSAEERAEVSKRMKRYWMDRRKQRKAPTYPGGGQ